MTRTEPVYTVVITLRRPTLWQTASEAAYGPMSRAQMDKFVASLPSTDLSSDVGRIVAYPLHSIEETPPP
jgi:hypothetical protein